MNCVACSTPCPSGVGSEIRYGTISRVPAIGASHVSVWRISAMYLITGRLGTCPAIGANETAQTTTVPVAFVGSDPVETLERKLQIVAHAAVEDRKPPIAGLRHEGVAIAGHANDRRCHRIKHAAPVRLLDRDPLRIGTARRLRHVVLHRAGRELHPDFVVFLGGHDTRGIGRRVQRAAIRDRAARCAGALPGADIRMTPVVVPLTADVNWPSFTLTCQAPRPNETPPKVT